MKTFANQVLPADVTLNLFSVGCQILWSSMNRTRLISWCKQRVTIPVVQKTSKTPMYRKLNACNTRPIHYVTIPSVCPPPPTNVYNMICHDT